MGRRPYRYILYQYRYRYGVPGTSTVYCTYCTVPGYAQVQTTNNVTKEKNENDGGCGGHHVLVLLLLLFVRRDHRVSTEASVVVVFIRTCHCDHYIFASALTRLSSVDSIFVGPTNNPISIAFLLPLSVQRICDKSLEDFLNSK